ncbi:serine hydrolase domain-containing protein [Bacillus sp. FJAT-27245]|uniref:serine hydrolase domain-containing protein n=1 Tax=Bacillus sp. FJAT-27245 TaxID=1684144 RepID=UPI0006A782A4|nr:serine hydrolase domain-containing protein [Bacillus sp. FJAT-27245]
MKNPDSKLDQITDFINGLCEEQHTVGISVSITLEKEIVYAKGFGYSQLGKQPLKKITPNTIMSIQSVSKNFMATSILQLEESGLIDLDDRLVDYLPYFQTKDNKLSDKITIRQVLSHTAGFPSDLGIANLIAPHLREIHSGNPTGYQNVLDYFRLTEKELNQIKSREDITKWFSKVELSYPPGAEWQYCTDAYVIVCDLFEKVSGQCWESHLQKNIFQPLGMTRTTCDHSCVEADDDIASYYLGEEMKPMPYPKNPISAPIGFIYSTANDLAKYLSAHMEVTSILKNTSKTTMQTPVTYVTGDWKKESEVRGYGLAFFTDNYKGLKLVEHAGGQLAVRASISMIPEKKLGVTVLLNFNSPIFHTINRKVFDILCDL